MAEGGAKSMTAARFNSGETDRKVRAPYYIHPDQPPVQAWSVSRLPFQPKEPMLSFRSELRTKIKSLAVEPGQIVACTYQSADESFVDVENVLVYNVGESCFSKVAAEGIRFERVSEAPPQCPEPLSNRAALHYVSYRIMAPSVELAEARRGRMVAIWADAEWPEHAGTSPTLFWLAIRKAHVQKANALRGHGALFGLSLTVTGGGRPISPAKMIKPLFDAAISAFHRHNDPESMGKAIDRLVERGRGSAAFLELLLTDPEFDLLGPRDLLSAYRSGANSDGVKWNPEDERCFAGELLWRPASGPKRFSGELFEVLPRAD